MTFRSKVKPWDDIEQKYSSRKTSINRSRTPAVFKKVNWEPNTVNADLGGGRYDNATEYLLGQGVTNYIYDPFNRPPKCNELALSKIKGGQCDTVTISNVLCVIKEPENRYQLLINAIDCLKLGGVVYITIYAGNGTGVGRSTTGGYQLNKKIREYLPEIKLFFNDTTLKNNMITAKSPKLSNFR